MGQRDISKIGEEAWQDARELLSSLGWKLQQIDWLGEKDGQWIKFEVKHQEAFEPPPFKGHGLPRWQIESSMRLMWEKGIRTILMIKDIPSGIWYTNYLDELESGKYHDTFGKSPRRIYPLDSFKELAKGDLNNV